MNEIVGILLAAGTSQRFGSQKLLQPLASGELVGLAAAQTLISNLPRSLAVVRPDEQVLADRFSALGLQVIENPHAEDGMGSSLAAGVGASAEAGGWMVALADMPWIRPQTILSLTDELRHGASLIAPVYQERRGHPVGFHRKWRSQLLALTGDQGARALLAQQAGELTLRATDDPGVLLDIDLPVDLRRM